MEDIWSEWLKHRRFGGDAAYQASALNNLKKIATNIIDKAEIPDFATVLDIGAGDGLVGLTALSRLGHQGKLILSDISETALRIPKEIFIDQKVNDSRVEFLVARAENLSELSDGSIDRVLMRAVLLYTNDKQAVFNEVYRVLRDDGVAVIMEPINQRHIEFGVGFFRGYRLDREPLLSVRSLLQKVIDNLMQQNQASLLGYDEHDLVNYSIRAGFEEIKLEYNFMRSSQGRWASLKVLLDTASNPQSSTLRESMTNILNPEEFNQVEGALQEVFSQSPVWTNSEALLLLKKI